MRVVATNNVEIFGIVIAHINLEYRSVGMTTNWFSCSVLGCSSKLPTAIIITEPVGGKKAKWSRFSSTASHLAHFQESSSAPHRSLSVPGQ